MTHRNPLSGSSGASAKNHGWSRILLVCAVFIFVASTAFAQEATIVGTVTDPTGAVVPKAKISATKMETGLASDVYTGSDGQYVIPALAIGHYTVKVSAQGFKDAIETGLVLQVGDRTRVDFHLVVGTAATQSVTVEAAEVHIQTDTGEVSDVISGAQVQKLETNGRSIYTLINLTPGATSLQTDDQVPTSVSGNANVSFDGQRMSHNLYMLDGGEDDDRGGAGTFSVVPSLESIAEFQILSSNYSPEYGLSSAATMTTVLKSGTKSFHGSAWEVDRNDALDADNYFQPGKKPELRSNIFGFNVGGPVSFHPNSSEPKTFFFYNQEWRRFVNGGSLNQLVPLPGTYQGNFTGSGVTPAVPCAASLSPALQTKFKAAGVTTFSTSAANGSCEYNVTFANDTIPAALLDANAQALLTAGKIFPANSTGTTAATAYFKGGANSPTNVGEQIVRIDHKFNDKFSIFGHWVSEQVAQDFGTTMWSGDNVPTIGNTFGNPSYSAVIHATATINQNLLNETAFNYNGNRIHILPKAAFGASLAYPSSYTPARIFGSPDPDNEMPTINLSNQTGTQYSPNWTPWNNDANSYQFRDDLSWVKGAHQFKFGADYMLYSKLQDFFASPEGNFGFNGFFSNYDFADFLLGLSNSYSEDAVHQNGDWVNNSYAFYAADNWHATSRLTLNLGLRWDGVPHTYEKNHHSSDFYPSLYQSSAAATFDSAGNLCSGASDPGCTAITPGLGTSFQSVLSGYQFYLNGIGIGGTTPGVPAGLVKNYWNAWGPRLGLSYDVTGQGKTVVRAGTGIMYERIQGNDMYDGATNVPADVTANFSNVELANPHISAQTGSTLQVPIVVPSITGLDENNYKLPVVYQYSFGVQQSINGTTLLSASYVGSQSRHQNDYRETNLPPQSDLATLINNSSTYNQMVPYLGFRSIKQAENVADGSYNSLQFDMHTVVHKDLQAQFGYTFSKSNDPTTGGGNGFDLDPVDNPYQGWSYDKGPSIFDRRSVAFVNYIYNIPLFEHSSNALAKSVLGGWEIAGITTMETGAPLNVTLGGNAGSNGVQNGTNFPNLSGSVSYPKTRGTNSVQWFSPGSFTAPALGAWGTLGHDALRGPGRDEWNIALHKIFKFTEHSQFEFRAETFNAFNHPQWQADVSNGGYGSSCGWNGTTCSGGNFGAITSAYDPREFQLYGKISF
jgi:hypothetical protein